MSAGSRSEPGSNARLSALLQHAAALVAAGEREQAIDALRLAVRVAPQHAAIHHDLGFLYLQSGRLADAAAALRIALRLDPVFAQAWLCLGMTLQDLNDLPGAEAAYRRALLLQPSLTVASVCLGALMESRGDATQAIEVFQKGAAQAPATLWGRLAAARAPIADNRELDAEPALRELVALHPTNGMSQEMLATLLADTGRFVEAREGYGRAIAAAPALGGCYYDLVRCRRIEPEDTPLLDAMQTALQSAALSADAKLKVHLALGKAYDDLGSPHTAMRHFAAADAIRCTVTRFDSHAFEQRVDRLIAYFNAARFAATGATAARAAPSHGHLPLFIMGLPRSGTTLVEQILSSHPMVYPAGELSFWTRRGHEWERSVLQTGALERLAREYTTLLGELAPLATRVTDKMPLNILWAGLIHLALPGATLIYCHRRAVDTALSIHRTYCNPQVAFPTGGRDLVTAIRAVERLAAHWRTVLPASRFIDLSYERLATEPQSTIRRLVADCHLPWDEVCLRPEGNSRVIKTPSKWQARQPIHAGAVDSWRRYEPWLGPLSALVT